MGFFKSMILVKIGAILGGDYAGKFVSLSCDARAKYDGLLILSTFGKDVKYEQSDVVEFNVLEYNTKFKAAGQLKIGNKYKVVCTDGKSFIMGIVSEYTSKVESLFLL